MQQCQRIVYIAAFLSKIYFYKGVRSSLLLRPLRFCALIFDGIVIERRDIGVDKFYRALML